MNKIKLINHGYNKIIVGFNILAKIFFANFRCKKQINSCRKFLFKEKFIIQKMFFNFKSLEFSKKN